MTTSRFRLSGLALLAIFACARAVPPPSFPKAAETVNASQPVLVASSSAEPERPPAPPAEPEARRELRRVASPRRLPSIPNVVRVGLSTDLSAVTLPCCESDLVAVSAESEITLVSNFRVLPGVEAAEPTVWRLQVAALRDEFQARDSARRIGERLSLAASTVFDAETGLYRVRVGAFGDREEAEQARSRLLQHNILDAWIVSEQKAIENPMLVLEQGGRRSELAGRWLAFEARNGSAVAALGKRYRGRLLVYLNDRGTLNLINEVGLDDYLRGVVPREMGPEVYDNIEALKAQAVAARTYTLRNMGEFSGEGFDICATPRCQVYGGMSAEHELSDRAVIETSQEVLVFDGEYIDALYSSTCGGHTEDVSIVFPLKTAAYLRGVPCSEAGVDRVAGTVVRSTPLEVGISRLLIPPGEPIGSASDLAARLKQLARLAGLPTRVDYLSTLERREVQRFIGSQFDLAVDARLLVDSADIPYLLESPPADWSREDLRLAAYLVKAGLLAGPLDKRLEPEEVEETIFHLSLFLRVLEERSARYRGVEHGRLLVTENGKEASFDLLRKLATFSRRSDGFVSTPLALVPGDRLKLFVSRNELIGIAHEVDLDGVAYDRSSNLSSWTRFRSDQQIAELVRQRYPAVEFSDLEILERGVSGRVGRLQVRGRDGSEIEIVGLPVRWTLDLPDTLFTAKRLAPAGGDAGWLFTGRGWGHGVGMCQVGSYGMALRGHSYREILLHYYSGVELIRASAGG